MTECVEGRWLYSDPRCPHVLCFVDWRGLAELEHQRVGVQDLYCSSLCLEHTCHIIFGAGQLFS